MLEYQFGVGLQARGGRDRGLEVRGTAGGGAFARRSGGFIEGNCRRFKYSQGWISQDEAAQQGAGLIEADAPEPRNAATTTGAGNVANLQADPGSQRGVGVTESLLYGMRLCGLS